ncbi:MAG TPA: hypothetical protein VFX85_04385 [Solirubrobacterales bacterium]|nr:hypothetical protein [Solirubrobacterales bacterium]
MRREVIKGAMLQASGELGYRHVTMQRLLDLYDGNRAQFYGQFPNLGACFLEAYETEASRLCAELLEAGAGAPSWRAGLGAALEALAGFVEARPMQARALLIEVHSAGDAALAKRKELLERLSDAVDSVRRETWSRHSPPPLTALFIVSAIEAAVVAALTAGEPARFRAIVPELVEVASAAYFDDP